MSYAAPACMSETPRTRHCATCSCVYLNGQQPSASQAEGSRWGWPRMHQLLPVTVWLLMPVYALT